MKLRFQNDVEDVVAFTRYFYANTPLLERQVRNLALLYFLLFGSVFLMIALSEGDAGVLCAAFGLAAALGVGTYFFMRPLLLWQCERNTRRLHQQQPDKAAFAERELEIVADALIDSTELCWARWKLSAIEDIVETSDHVFLRISPMRAYILPRDQLDPAELEAFLDDLERSYYQPEKSPPPIRSEAIQADRRRPWRQEPR